MMQMSDYQEILKHKIPVFWWLKIACYGISLVVQWLRLCTSTAEVEGWSLVGELRSHMQRSTARKKKSMLAWSTENSFCNHYTTHIHTYPNFGDLSIFSTNTPWVLAVCPPCAGHCWGPRGGQDIPSPAFMGLIVQWWKQTHHKPGRTGRGEPRIHWGIPEWVSHPGWKEKSERASWRRGHLSCAIKDE